MKVINRIFWSLVIVFFTCWLPFLLESRAKKLFLGPGWVFENALCAYLAGLVVAVLWTLGLCVLLFCTYWVLIFILRWLFWIGTGNWKVTEIEKKIWD